MNWKIPTPIVVLIAFSLYTSFCTASKLSNPSQQGSLLIFPRVEALSPSNSVTGFSDTLINITNNSARPVNLQCYWGTTELYSGAYPVRRGGNTANNRIAKFARAAIRRNHYMAFSFTLPKNEPASFWAGDLSSQANGVGLDANGIVRLHTSKSVPRFNNFQDGFRSNVGELRCWAINPTGQTEIHHNHLAGKATIFSFAAKNNTPTPIAEGQSYQYNAWAFQAYYQGSNADRHTGKPLPTPGQLNLDGKEYDLCPSLLVSQFVPTGRPFINANSKTRTQLSLVNCQADLRIGGYPNVTNLAYTVYNANEVKFSGASECMGGWTESEVGKSFSNFSYNTLKTDSAYVIIRPAASRLCNKGWQTAGKEKDIHASGIVGIQVNDTGGKFQTSSELAAMGDGSNVVKPIASTIYWDPSVDGIGKK